MLTRNRGRRGNQGFTLIEMLVTLVLIGVLASLTAAVLMKSKGRARLVSCLSHQQEISKALVNYYEDHVAFPPDGPNSDMAIALSGYIPWLPRKHDIELPGVYRCPNDRTFCLLNSYQPYYVRRKAPRGSDFFVLGCPRHTDADSTYLNTSGLNSTIGAKAGAIRIDGSGVTAESSVGRRTTADGTMRFEDNSTAEVTETSDNFRVTAVSSFRKPDGCLYTLVRVEGVGEAKFEVTPGSKFEVVTPVAIIGVRGTKFTVSTVIPDELRASLGLGDAIRSYTSVFVTRGAVQVWDRLSQRTQLLQPGQSAQVGPADEDLDVRCIHCPVDCKNGRHCPRCPQHVGLPDNIGTHKCVQCKVHGGGGQPTVRVSGPYFDDKWAYFRVTNPADRKVVVTGLSISWPTRNRQITMICRDGVKIWQFDSNNGIVDAPPPSFSVARWWQPDRPWHRWIGPKDTDTLKFKFRHHANKDPKRYSLSVVVAFVDADAGNVGSQHCPYFCPLSPENRSLASANGPVVASPYGDR